MVITNRPPYIIYHPGIARMANKGKCLQPNRIQRHHNILLCLKVSNYISVMMCHIEYDNTVTFCTR